MYLPPKFKSDDQELMRSMISENPLATVITVTDKQEPFVSHLPLVLLTNNDTLTLLGHMACANPHVQAMQKNSKTKVIFHGPHAYISPTWYAENDVPTWNYVVIHIDGQARLIEDDAGIVGCLRALSETIKRKMPEEFWKFWIPDDLLEEKSLSAAIIGFEIHVTKLNAKFKLSQNRSAADRQGIIDGLSRRSDDMSLRIRDLILSNH